MSTTQKMSVAEAAAKLASNPEIAANIEKQIGANRMVMMLIHMRVDKKLTQKDIADCIGCSSSRISKLESGKDADLEWSDIMGYLRATKTTMSIMLDTNREMPAAVKIKQHVFEIDSLLRELVTLAGGDVGKEIVDKINQFSGDVLMNFLRLFGDNYQNLQTIVKMYSNDSAIDSSSTTVVETQTSPCLSSLETTNK